MAFDNVNKVSEKELTDELALKINNKVDQVNFNAHVANGVMHITAQERVYWNNALPDAKTYTDNKFDTIIGTNLVPNKTIMDLINLKLDESVFNTFKNNQPLVAKTGDYNDLLNKPSHMATADQANFAINAGMVNNISFYVGAVAPANPINNRTVWFDVTSGLLMVKVYSNNAWLSTCAVFK